MVLVLAAVAGLAAVRRERLGPTTVPTTGWRTFSDPARNLRFRYPPDWRVELDDTKLEPRMLWLVPPELADGPARQEALSVRLDSVPDFWVGSNWFGTARQGRLPGGQAYLRTADERGGYRHVSWSVDWGRPCLGDKPACVPHSVRVIVDSADRRLWDRHLRVVEAVVGTLERLRPTAPSTGDRTLRSCRPGQWRLVWPEEYEGARGDHGSTGPGSSGGR